MSAESSYERIEFFLRELKAQTRSDTQAAYTPVPDLVATQHVQMLLTLFHENLRELAQPPVTSPRDASK